MITKLKLERIKNQFSQEFLGKRSGISQSRISLIERGLQEPKHREAQRLSEILGIERDEIFNKIVREL